jgi:hypothetical protein
MPHVVVKAASRGWVVRVTHGKHPLLWRRNPRNELALLRALHEAARIIAGERQRGRP